MADMTLSEELQWRGFVNQTTLPDIQALDTPGIKFYFGVDPSANSMTVGNLATLLMTKLFKKHGHIPYLLVGGATGMIGDPSGKDEERQLLTLDQVAENKQRIAEQFRRIMDDPGVELVDNYDWFKDMGYLEFLRDVGKHFSMTPLLQRDYIATRIGPEGSGISYAEFSYTLIQGYDFLHLYRTKGVTLQVCGSDQWGNSISGVELIRRVEGAEAHIWSAPLIINKTTGKKFGKSEDGAVWLDSGLTSVYKFYQFWLNVDDEGVQEYLKIFTELDKPAIDDILQRFNEDRASRLAQRILAYEVTKIVHGQERAEAVKHASEVLFGQGSFLELNDAEKEILKQELPVAKAEDDFSQTIVNAGLAASKTEARNFFASGAISVNGHKVTPEQPMEAFRPGDNLLKRGKNSFAIIEN
jgi:tyrosyl-tRNA synthetase